MTMDRHPTEDLPAYALGALEESERESITTHVAKCDQCTRELAAFEDALYEAAAVGATGVGAPGREATVNPPRDLRTRIVLRHRGARVVGCADPAIGTSVIAMPLPAPNGEVSTSVNTPPSWLVPAGTATGPGLSTHASQALPDGGAGKRTTRYG